MQTLHTTVNSGFSLAAGSDLYANTFRFSTAASVLPFSENGEGPIGKDVSPQFLSPCFLSHSVLCYAAKA